MRRPGTPISCSPSIQAGRRYRPSQEIQASPFDGVQDAGHPDRLGGVENLHPMQVCFRSVKPEHLSTFHRHAVGFLVRFCVRIAGCITSRTGPAPAVDGLKTLDATMADYLAYPGADSAPQWSAAYRTAYICLAYSTVDVSCRGSLFLTWRKHDSVGPSLSAG